MVAYIVAWQLGINVVVVHGGGPQIAAMLKRLNIESNFIAVSGALVLIARTTLLLLFILIRFINTGLACNG